MRLIGLVFCLIGAGALPSRGSLADATFLRGLKAYRDADFAHAAQVFDESAKRIPAAGTLQNLGNSQWQRGLPGRAILAWEQALWVDPWQKFARQNLRFARKIDQIEAPELAWYEVASTWLPVDWWAWLAGSGFWLAVGMALVPGVLRRPRATWHQAVAALGVTLFLLSVPAHLGVLTRSRIGFVLEKQTPLRLTPTSEAQAVTHLAAGEPVRWERARGDYVLVRSSRTEGWLQRSEFGLITANGARQAAYNRDRNL